MSSDISECDIRVPENLIFRKTAVYVVIGGLTGLGMCGDLAVTYRSTCNGKKCLSEAMTFVFTAAFTSP
jgi:Na+/H+ antiporter NhaD/arsenite permease-like protein